MNSPYPKILPYWKGYDREKDERHARNLLYGVTVRNQKTGRDQHRYLLRASPREHQGLEALRRLLSRAYRDIEPRILAGLLCALDPNSNFDRRLVFERRKKGRPQDSAADLQIFLHVEGYIRGGKKTEAAVAQTMADLRLSRKAVFTAVQRCRRERPWLKS
jgi:hypothetical protein